MRFTWEKVAKPIITALLDDKDDVDFEEDDLMTWWNNGQYRLATQKPQTRHQQYHLEDGNPFPKPQLHYKPVAIFIRDYPEPLSRLATELALLKPTEIGFYLYEEKVAISGFASMPSQWLYVYQSYFPRIVNREDLLTVPEWSLEALGYYVGMQAMALKATGDARYRQYTAPPDATGTPVHNPYLKVAEWFEKRYQTILNNHVDDDEDFRW